MKPIEQLTLQQKRFCDEYLVSFNAFQSAIKAGYSENTARKADLLHLPKIQAYLQQAMAKTSQRLQITHDMILQELAKVAFANMGDYYDEDGVLKPMNKLTANEKAAINQYQVLDAVNDEGQRIGELSKIKLHNKMSALDKIARHTGFYNAAGKEESYVLPVTGCGLDGEAESCELLVMGCGLDEEEESCVLPVMGCGLEQEEESCLSVETPSLGKGVAVCEVAVMGKLAHIYSTDPSLHPPVGRESHEANAFLNVSNIVSEDTNSGEDEIDELDEKFLEKILTISPLPGKVRYGVFGKKRELERVLEEC